MSGKCTIAATASATDNTLARSEGRSGSVAVLLPIMGVLLVAFLVVGLALPVLPLHVHQGLGLSTFVVGLVTGSQFAASLISRMWSGRYADSRGAKRAVVVGLLTAAVAGLIYLLSLRFAGTPWLSATILLIGRALLGGAESLVITGAVSWGLALAGPANAGRVIAWVGMAVFAALAVGAPMGTALYAIAGFTAVAAATVLLPLLTVLLVIPLSPVPIQRGAQTGAMTALGAVWLPGFGAALSTVGFGAMIAFSSLLAAERGWSPVWLMFSAFAAALVAARLFLGHAPDRFGGARVALASIFIEAAGLALIYLRVRSCSRHRRRSAHRVRLLTDLSGPRRRSRAPRVPAKPRARDGRLHGFSRRGAWVRQSRARAGCGLDRVGFGVSCQRDGRAVRGRGGRVAAACHRFRERPR